MIEDQIDALVHVGRRCALDPSCRALMLLDDGEIKRHLLIYLAKQGLIREWHVADHIQYVGMTEKGQKVACKLITDGVYKEKTS